MKTNDYCAYISEKLNTTCPPFDLDGEIFRFDKRINGKNKKNVCWAVGNSWIFNNKQYYVVNYGDWSNPDNNGSWKSWKESQVSNAFMKKAAIAISELKEKNIEEKKKRNEECAAKWLPKYLDGTQDPLHPYLKNKGIKDNYVGRVLGKNLLVPVSDFKRFWGVQVISENKKTFATGLNYKGSFCVIDTKVNDDTVYISEGFATACTIREVLNKISVCCFTANNILPVARSFRKNNPDTPIVICADNDQYGDKNTGIEAAKKAMMSVENVRVVTPVFKDTTTKPTDFNDLYLLEGASAVFDLFETKDIENIFYKEMVKSGFSRFNERGILIREQKKLQSYFNYLYKYLVDQYTGDVYIYDSGYYQQVNENKIKEFAQINFNPEVERENEAREFVNIIRRYNLVDIEKIKQIDNKKICLLNGTYDYNENKLIPHSPDHKLFTKINVNYKENEKCPTWDLLISNLATGRDPIISVLNEFAGYAISGMPYVHQKALILKGGGKNGKTTYINALANFVGTKNFSSASVARMASNRFEASALRDKLVNFSEEDPPKIVFNDTSAFKQLTGNSPMMIERKGINAETVINKAKIIMAYNEIPYLSDFSEGIRRRLLIVPFDLDLTRSPEKAIPNVLEKLKKEHSGMLNKFISSLAQLEMCEDFTVVPETKNEINEMIKNSDSVREWWSECVEISNNVFDRESITDLYENYKDEMGGMTRVTKLGFGKKLRSIIIELRRNNKNKVDYKTYKVSGTRSNKKGVIGIKLLF